MELLRKEGIYIDKIFRCLLQNSWANFNPLHKASLGEVVSSSFK